MYDLLVTYNEDDFGPDCGAIVTVFGSLAEDTEPLLDLYAAMGVAGPTGEADAMDCETCTKTVLVVERGVYGTRIITEFRPFATDTGDNGSGVILCLPCLLYGVANGGSIITTAAEPSESAGRHRAA